jgi:hypothetical protein
MTSCERQRERCSGEDTAEEATCQEDDYDRAGNREWPRSNVFEPPPTENDKQLEEEDLA